MAKKYVKLHLGASKKAVAKGIGNLRTALKANPQFSSRTLGKYEKAIKSMTAAQKLLNGIGCDPPDMSFEIPPPPSPARARTRARSRTR
jgi:hypothetical protein